MIKTIPMWKMMMATKGKKTGLAILSCLPVFIVTGAWMFLEGLQNGQKRQAAMGLIGLIFLVCASCYLHLQKNIFPAKHFRLIEIKSSVQRRP
ncbi:hypothetical protein [Pseudomonas sp. PDM02]|uniref:hypothetical protein n=1 Tax=Pseudomonas sp. PDM02 TaxID=2769267 RepID=UPI001CE04A15|nr:hypothetical protein [Pseudomonas sp. PDM02]